MRFGRTRALRLPPGLQRRQGRLPHGVPVVGRGRTATREFGAGAERPPVTGGDAIGERVSDLVGSKCRPQGVGLEGHVEIEAALSVRNRSLHLVKFQEFYEQRLRLCNGGKLWCRREAL